MNIARRSPERRLEGKVASEPRPSGAKILLPEGLGATCNYTGENRLRIQKSVIY